MIAYLRGSVIEKGDGLLVLDVQGVGYEVHAAPSTLARLGERGAEAELFISESVGIYGGGTTLYGFLSREDQRMFLAFKQLKATGAKKALDYLEKASRSLPDFRRAILDQDARALTTLFGFTRKTAELLLAELKGKLGLPAGSAERGRRPADDPPPGSPLASAVDALAGLGYKPAECRAAIDAVRRELGQREARLEEILRMALRRISR